MRIEGGEGPKKGEKGTSFFGKKPGPTRQRKKRGREEKGKS